MNTKKIISKKIAYWLITFILALVMAMILKH